MWHILIKFGDAIYSWTDLSREDFSFSWPTQEFGDWKVVKTPRRLDAYTCPELTAECNYMLDRYPYLVLDLSATVFLTSAGLAMFALLSRKARDNGGELRLTNCSKDVRSVLRMARFDRFFVFYENVLAATA